MEELLLEDDKLYQKVAQKICKKIFYEEYKEGERIPSERQLLEELGVSRITVRKALQILKDERIITQIHGSGTYVEPYYGPRQGNMEIITLVAAAQNDFFSNFMDAFQISADKNDSLVLFKQKPKNIPLEECLFQIYEKRLRNVVIWLQKMNIEERMLRKLRGLGMNIVLFDEVDSGTYADAICLDNAGAINRLYSDLKENGCKKIIYISWDAVTEIGSLRIREETFRKLEPNGTIVHIPMQYQYHLQDIPEESIMEIMNTISDCDGVIYAVDELGMFFEDLAKKKKMNHKAGIVDAVPGAENMGVFVVGQDFPRMAAQVMECLQKQNQADSGWKAKTYRIKGLRQ